MKHIELLNLLCKNRKLLDEAYRQKKLISVPNELVNIGLFSKIGGYYYINEVYLNFIDTLLARADFSYIAEDFEEEVKKLLSLREEYKLKSSKVIYDLIIKLFNKIYQGMINRDKRVKALIENLENDSESELDFLISEAKNILARITEIMEKNEKIYMVFEEFLEFSEFSELVKDILFEMILLNQNIDSYLKRLQEFIAQTERKRKFNQKLFKLAADILNEEAKIDNFLMSKRFVYKQKIISFSDSAYLDTSKIKKIIGEIKKERVIKKSEVRTFEEVINLIDIKKLIEYIKGSEDIFRSIIEYVGEIDRELLNESVRVFVYILNHFDRNLEYTKEYNEFNVKVVKWKG